MQIPKSLYYVSAAAPVVLGLYLASELSRYDAQTVCKTNAVSVSTMLSYKKTLGALAFAGLGLLAAWMFTDYKNRQAEKVGRVIQDNRDSWDCFLWNACSGRYSNYKMDKPPFVYKEDQDGKRVEITLSSSEGKNYHIIAFLVDNIIFCKSSKEKGTPLLKEGQVSAFLGLFDWKDRTYREDSTISLPALPEKASR